MEHVSWSDRGQQVQAELSDSPGKDAQFVAVSRLGSTQLGARFTLLIQVRGSAWVEAKEGRFRLRAGDWLALDRESRPLVQADRDGLTIGLALGSDAPRQMARYADCSLYAGRGRVGSQDLRTALRLWRDAAGRMARPDADGLCDGITGVRREVRARGEPDRRSPGAGEAGRARGTRLS